LTDDDDDDDEQPWLNENKVSTSVGNSY